MMSASLQHLQTPDEVGTVIPGNPSNETVHHYFDGNFYSNNIKAILFILQSFQEISLELIFDKI